MDKDLEDKIRWHIETEDASMARVMERLDKAQSQLDSLGYDIKSLAAEQERQGHLIGPLTEFIEGMISVDKTLRALKHFIGYVTLLAAGISLTYFAITGSVGRD